MVTVLVATMALTITLMSIYVYVVNQTRHYARIKEAYKLIDVMAGAAKDIRYTWDLAGNKAAGDANSCCLPVGCLGTSSAAYGTHACGACGPMSLGCVQDIAFTSQAIATATDSCTTSAAACCALCPAYGANTASMCFDNPDNTGLPYCFYQLTENNQVQYNIVTPDQIAQKHGRLEKFVVKLDGFFEGEILEDIPKSKRDMKEIVATRAPGFWNWVVAEKQALAIAGPHATGPCCGNPVTSPADYTTTIPASPTCTYSATTNGCMTCGPGTGRQCSEIVACPLSFLPCSTWTGTAATALFGQEFVMEPPGVCWDPINLVPTMDPKVCF